MGDAKYKVVHNQDHIPVFQALKLTFTSANMFF